MTVNQFSISRVFADVNLCVNFMFRELFPRMDIQLSPEIAIRLYYHYSVGRGCIMNHIDVRFFNSRWSKSQKPKTEREKWSKSSKMSDPFPEPFLPHTDTNEISPPTAPRGQLHRDCTVARARRRVRVCVHACMREGGKREATKPSRLEFDG